MRPNPSDEQASGDDSGEEDFPVLLPNLEEPALAFGEESIDVVEHGEGSGRNGQPHPKVDASFFNKFDDDFDESDMKPSS